VADCADLARRLGIGGGRLPGLRGDLDHDAVDLPANRAVAVHPEFIYDLVRTPKGILIVARDLADAAIKRYGFEAVETVAQIPGAALEGLRCSIRSTTTRCR
jgi:isoleucyl-tRNA synthetase